MATTKILQNILARPENRLCADCKARNPRWASLNFGIFVCIDCSGFHRKMGTHITKIKSVTLDSWNEQMLCLYGEMNNEIANSYWEYSMNEAVRPQAGSSGYTLEQFIRDKYENMRYVNQEEINPVQRIFQGQTVEIKQKQQPTQQFNTKKQKFDLNFAQKQQKQQPENDKNQTYAHTQKQIQQQQQKQIHQIIRQNQKISIQTAVQNSYKEQQASPKVEVQKQTEVTDLLLGFEDAWNNQSQTNNNAMQGQGQIQNQNEITPLVQANSNQVSQQNNNEVNQDFMKLGNELFPSNIQTDNNGLNQQQNLQQQNLPQQPQQISQQSITNAILSMYTPQQTQPSQNQSEPKKFVPEGLLAAQNYVYFQPQVMYPGVQQACYMYPAQQYQQQPIAMTVPGNQFSNHYNYNGSWRGY